MPSSPRERIDPLLAAVRDLLAQRETWLEVRQAHAAQDALLSDAVARRDQLQRRLTAARTPPPPSVPPTPIYEPPSGWQPPTPVKSGAKPGPAAPPASRPFAPPQNRARLAEWAARYRHALAVEAGVLMRINQIVEDGSRPLGEAVALLPDAAFAPLWRESEQEYAERLRAWAESLEEAERRIEGDVRRDEMNLRQWLGVRDLWLKRDEAEGRLAWEAYVKRCREEIATETDALQAELEGLEKGDAP